MTARAAETGKQVHQVVGRRPQVARTVGLDGASARLVSSVIGLRAS